MGVRNVDMRAKETGRIVANIPGVAGDYAGEMITFPADPASAATSGDSFQAVTILVEDYPSDGSHLGPIGTAPWRAELWLPRVVGTDKESSALDPANDYYFAGQAVYPVGTSQTPAGVTVSYGSGTFILGGYPGAQVRVRSGGVKGTVAVSASAL